MTNKHHLPSVSIYLCVCVWACVWSCPQRPKEVSSLWNWSYKLLWAGLLVYWESNTGPLEELVLLTTEPSLSPQSFLIDVIQFLFLVLFPELFRVALNNNNNKTPTHRTVLMFYAFLLKCQISYKSIICFYLVLVTNKKGRSIFILHMNVQFSQHHLFKRLFFSPIIFLAPLSNQSFSLKMKVHEIPLLQMSTYHNELEGLVLSSANSFVTIFFLN